MRAPSIGWDSLGGGEQGNGQVWPNSEFELTDVLFGGHNDGEREDDGGGVVVVELVHKVVVHARVEALEYGGQVVEEHAHGERLGERKRKMKKTKGNEEEERMMERRKEEKDEEGRGRK